MPVGFGKSAFEFALFVGIPPFSGMHHPPYAHEQDYSRRQPVSPMTPSRHDGTRRIIGMNVNSHASRCRNPVVQILSRFSEPQRGSFIPLPVHLIPANHTARFFPLPSLHSTIRAGTSFHEPLPYMTHCPTVSAPATIRATRESAPARSTLPKEVFAGCSVRFCRARDIVCYTFFHPSISRPSGSPPS